jgi:hypothetical protein
VLATPAPVLIGARSAVSTTNNNLAFYGTIDDVALYNYPLSVGQIRNHYYATTNVPATLQSDIPTSTVVYAGRPLSLTAGFVGSPPLTYQWFQNCSPIPGATTNYYSVPNTRTNDGGTYYVQACNNYPAPNTCAQSSMSAVTVETVVDFNPANGTSPGIGAGWGFQVNDTVGIGGRGYDTTTPDAVLTLSDGNNSEASATFYQQRLYVGAFRAFFTYTDVGGGGADGISFCIQNDSRGPAAIGGAGGGLAVNGITPSVEFELNIYGPNTPGYFLGLNGGNGNGAYLTTGGINVASGDAIDVTLTYVNNVLSVHMLDETSTQTFDVPPDAINIPTQLGTNTAWVGFTGATGGVNSTQRISNFSYIPTPTISITRSGGNIILTWPAVIGGYTLLERSSFLSGAWAVSGATVSVVGANYQATIAPSGASKFYKLGLDLNNPQ